MELQVAPRYVLDPADPRAPSDEQWAVMSPAERERALDSLPIYVPLELLPAEGDLHREAKEHVLQAVGSFVRALGRRLYVSSELGVFYPGEPRFAPDLLAVADVESFPRSSWIVAREGKGLDWVLEVHVDGHRRKDTKRNVERYARLGIHEYFLFDRTRRSLQGYRLAPGERSYQTISHEGGAYHSEVLELDLALRGDRLCFFAGNARLEDQAEQIARLGVMLDDVLATKEAAELAVEAERQRANAEQERADDAERRLAEALADLERLRAEAAK